MPWARVRASIGRSPLSGGCGGPQPASKPSHASGEPLSSSAHRTVCTPEVSSAPSKSPGHSTVVQSFPSTGAAAVRGSSSGPTTVTSTPVTSVSCEAMAPSSTGPSSTALRGASVRQPPTASTAGSHRRESGSKRDSGGPPSSASFDSRASSAIMASSCSGEWPCPSEQPVARRNRGRAAHTAKRRTMSVVNTSSTLLQAIDRTAPKPGAPYGPGPLRRASDGAQRGGAAVEPGQSLIVQGAVGTHQRAAVLETLGAQVGGASAGLLQEDRQRGGVPDRQFRLRGDVDRAFGDHHVRPEVPVGACAPHRAGQAEEGLQTVLLLPAGQGRETQRGVGEFGDL